MKFLTDVIQIVAVVVVLGVLAPVVLFADDVLPQNGSVRATWANYDAAGGTSKDVDALAGFEAGIPSEAKAPLLVLSADPVLGTTPFLFVGPADPGADLSQALALVFLGLERANISTELGNLLVRGSAFLVPMRADGVLIALPIPSDPALAGFDVFLQSLQRAPSGVAFSQGLQIHCGF